MIEAVDEDLCGEVVGNKCGEALTFVFAEGVEEFGIADLVACDEVLGEDGLTGELAVAFGADNLLASKVVVIETVEIVGLVGEVKLDLRSFLEFHNQALEVDSAYIPFDEFVKDLFKERKVACDGLNDPWTTDFNGHNSAIEQCRLMHLRDGSGS